MTAVKVTTPAVKLCPADKRIGLEVVSCKAKLFRGDCPDRAEHMLPFPSGWCDSGWCEGHKIDKPTCKFYMNCPHKCHQDLWFMFSLSEMDRVPMDNSTWKARGTFILPSRDDLIAERLASKITEPNGPQIIKSPAPGVVPDAMAVVYGPTPTGRTARGELEAWVREVTDVWVVEKGEVCTPKLISAMIAQRHGLGKQPSVGAVDAVLRRWVKIGFAIVSAKPIRFDGYTEAGIQFGLEFLRAKAKYGS